MPQPDRRAAPRTAPSTGSSGRVGPARLAGRPRLEPQSPQAHETSGVVVAERIGGLVGGQLVVVQPDRAPPAGDETAPGNRRPSMATGSPSSKASTISIGSAAVGLVSSKTSSGGWTQGSSRTPHSIVRPQRFWSIEYGLAFVTVTGMPNRSAYSIDCSRV